MIKLFSFLAIFFLAACATKADLIAKKEKLRFQELAVSQQECEAYGYIKGTNEFGGCMTEIKRLKKLRADQVRQDVKMIRLHGIDPEAAEFVNRLLLQRSKVDSNHKPPSLHCTHTRNVLTGIQETNCY